MIKVQPESQGFSSERLKLVSNIMNQYVDEGKIAGTVTLVARKGEVVHLDKYGYRNIAEKKPIDFDTLFRIYSMTKPITSVAFMMLYEKGIARLDDPVSKYLPDFKKMKVLDENGNLIPAKQEITIWNLLTHTAGFGYGDNPDNLIDKLILKADLENKNNTNKELCDHLAKIPLRYHPGEGWHYSYATDVLGHLTEVLSGMTLEDFFSEKIFKPLGMEETYFQVPEEKNPRFSELYGLTEKEQLGIIGNEIGGAFNEVKKHSGGAGLVSTLDDYYRFAQFLLYKGGESGNEILSPKTHELMQINHLPEHQLFIKMEDRGPGTGFGLGFSVLMDVAQANHKGSVGSFGWGGWASTHFWVDPIEEMIGIQLMQYIPSRTYPIREDFRNAVYQALID